MREGFSEILEHLEREQRHKLALKLPQWSGIDGIRIPSSLALEQCSSAAAALYKASLAPSGTIADLTSGLGVDVWAFARQSGIGKVFYNDINPELCDAAESNFKLLGTGNVEFSCLDAKERLDSLGKLDMIFIDPARRSSTGSKVFRLEECSPNLLELLPEIWKHTDMLMTKLSPMADISLIAGQLSSLAELHIVGTALECKELLCILRKGWTQTYTVTVAVLGGNGCKSLALENRKDLAVPLACTLEAGDFLLEPYPPLSKSGLNACICNRFHLKQLDRSTQLFTFDGKQNTTETSGYFKVYEVLETTPFGKDSFKRLGKLYPHADVSARNIPIKSEELKKKMGISGSGEIHIFGLSVHSERILAVCRQFSAR